MIDEPPEPDCGQGNAVLWLTLFTGACVGAGAVIGRCIVYPLLHARGLW